MPAATQALLVEKMEASGVVKTSSNHANTTFIPRNRLYCTFTQFYPFLRALLQKIYSLRGIVHIKDGAEGLGVVPIRGLRTRCRGGDYSALV
jgi:hypothetical protein